MGSEAQRGRFQHCVIALICCDLWQGVLCVCVCLECVGGKKGILFIFFNLCQNCDLFLEFFHPCFLNKCEIMCVCVYQTRPDKLS